MTISGTIYEVVKEVEVKGYAGRVEITLKLPRGRRQYHVVRYEDGTFSSVV